MWNNPKEHKLAGETLAEHRKSAGITQQELAQRLGKPQSFVSSYERGQRRIDLLELSRIADEIGADPAKICVEILGKLAKKPRRRR